MKKALLAVTVLVAVMFISFPVLAADVVVPMNLITDQGIGKSIGSVTISESAAGLVFKPHLTDLAPGIHGFHVHQNADCAAAMKEGKSVAGLAAGGHYDPASTGKHEGPMGKGHLGDLPALTAGPDGKADIAVTAPHIKTLAEIKGRSIMIHAGGDNYSDQPAPLGGGGARVACGVIK
ncbi:MAG TPA: superoxide dismutase [Cu-Zn] SodC [Nitrospirota bacterium]|nr:superoxide dismutase [Cu-Zn] SodC [Nitrospirota bacterium]